MNEEPELEQEQVEQPTVEIEPVQNLKQVALRLAGQILAQLDATFASVVEQDEKLQDHFTSHDELGFISREMLAEKPVVLKTPSREKVAFEFSINSGIPYKELVEILSNNISYPEKIKLIKDSTTGTYYEDLVTDNADEVEELIDASLKIATAKYKAAFSLWAKYLSAFYEQHHNLLVEEHIYDGELRLIGIWTLNAQRQKEKEFYINPLFLADKLNSQFKKLEKATSTSFDIRESLTALNTENSKQIVCTEIQASRNYLGSAMESTLQLGKQYADFSKLLGSGTATEDANTIDVLPELEEI